MSDSQNVLAVGYGPFEDVDPNPAWETVRSLDGKTIRGARVKALQLPVDLKKNKEILAEAIDESKPAVLIAMGVAPGRAVLSTERSGLNVLDTLTCPDNLGYQPLGDPVVPGGPAAYMSTIPIKAIVKRMREAGIPSAVSFSAGTHGCNQVMYWTSHYVATNNMDTKVGYIHTPSLPEYVAKKSAPYLYAFEPSMSLDLMVRGLEIAIDTSLELTEDIEMGCGFIC